MHRKIRILVAKADLAFVRMLEDSLKESGSPYLLEKVSSGQECFRVLQQKKKLTSFF